MTVEGERLLGKPARYEQVGFSEQGRAEELIQRFEGKPRKFTWVNLQSFRWVDGGYRGPQDFQRLKQAVAEVLLSASEGIFPLRIDGETCRFCAFRKVCGVPEDTYADPAYALEDLGGTGGRGGRA